MPNELGPPHLQSLDPDFFEIIGSDNDRALLRRVQPNGPAYWINCDRPHSYGIGENNAQMSQPTSRINFAVTSHRSITE